MEKIIESFHLFQTSGKRREIAEKFLSDSYPSAYDLRNGLNITIQRAAENNRIRLELKRGSIPKTGIWIDEDGKYNSEHYSSKPGLEIYGRAKFDTPQELFRHIWLRIVKNKIPSSLISKRDVEEKVDFDVEFPAGEGLNMDQIREKLKPIMGGFKLIHPTIKEIYATAEMKRLIDMGLVGKKENEIGKDISKEGKIKYKFYVNSLNRARELYGQVISELIYEHQISKSHKKTISGTLIPYENYPEEWTVTNTSRLPVNSVNYRTGENILKCRIETTEMFSGVYLSICKRTFERAKGNTVKERLVSGEYSGLSPEDKRIAKEINDLLSSYFVDSMEEADQTVFIEPEFDNTDVHENAKALLIKYLYENGSEELKAKIEKNPAMSEYLDMITKFENLDNITRKLKKLLGSLKYV